MNIRNILLSVVTGAIACSCNFSEDDCIRLGRLKAYCDFAEIEARDIPVPANRHLLAYGISENTLTEAEKRTFSEDTLRCDFPRGDYNFIFVTGSNEIHDMVSHRDCRLLSAVTEKNGKTYLSDKQSFVCKQLFSEHFEYQKETVRKIIPLPFTQTIVIRLHVSGNLSPIVGISSELDGIAVGKYLTMDKLCSESATLLSEYTKAEEGRLWESTNYVFGITPTADNILRITTHTTDTSGGTYNVDLSSYLRGFDKYKITIDLNLVVGEYVKVGDTVTIEDWKTGDIIQLN